MTTWGQKRGDGRGWDIDGLQFGKTGEAGTEPFGELEFAPIVFGDSDFFRQPLALNFHSIDYGAEERARAFWRFNGSFAHCYGAEMETAMLGEGLALTYVSARYWGIHTVVSIGDSDALLFGLHSTNYNDRAVICAIHLATGATIWTREVACADWGGFPQVEYLPYWGVIAVHADRGHLLDFDTGSIIYSWDRGAGVFEYEADARWLAFTPYVNSLYRYVKPTRHPAIDPESAADFGISNLWEPIRIHQTSFGNGPAQGVDAYLNYTQAGNPRDVLADGELHLNTPMFYCHARMGLELATDGNVLVRAFEGYGFKHWAVDAPTPVKSVSYLGLESVSVSGPAPADPDPPFPVYGTTTIDRAEVDRVGFALIFQGQDLPEGGLVYERVWSAADHVPAWYGLDGAQDSLDAYLALRLEQLEDAWPAFDFHVEGYLLSTGSPAELEIEIDQDAEFPGGHPHFGSSALYGLGNTALKLVDTADSTVRFRGYFERDWGNGGDAPFMGTRRIPLTAEILDVKLNGNKAVVMYRSPSRPDFVTLGAGSFYYFQRWSGAKTGSISSHDFMRPYPDIGQNYIAGKMCSSWAEMQGLNPDTGPIYYTHAAVADSPWIYYYRRPGGSEAPFWLVLQPNTPLNAAGKNFYYRGLTPTTSYFTDTGPAGSPPEDYVHYVWEGSWRVAGSPEFVVEYGRDFDYLVVPRGQTVPRHGYTGMAVLEIGEEGITELFVLEFGADAYLYDDEGAPVVVDGENVLTSGYPYVTAIPGKTDGVFILRQNFNWPHRQEGDHTTIVERNAWNGENLWYHEVPGNPWGFFQHAGYDPVAEKDWLLIQDTSTYALHLYDNEGYVRSYAPLEGYMDISSSWIINGEIYFTVYEAPEYEGDQETWKNKVVRL